MRYHNIPNLIHFIRQVIYVSNHYVDIIRHTKIQSILSY